MDKQKFVEIVLEKRFGKKNPKEMPNLLEVNTFTPADTDGNSISIGVQLIIKSEEKENIKEEYQVNNEGVVFSWGNTPVIDQRSQDHKL